MKSLSNKIENLINNSSYNEACEILANKLNFKLNILGVEFKSMPWDKDKQKRNVFTCELVRKNKSYIFEFGSSIVDSCDYIREIDTLSKKDKIKIYAGLKTGKGLSVGITLNLTLEEAENLDHEFIEEKANEMKNALDSQVKTYNEKISKKFSKEYVHSTGLHINSEKSNGMFIQCIENAVRRKLNDLPENKILSKDKQLQGKLNKPTLYDVLSCLEKYEVGTFEEFCDNFGYDQDSREAERTYNSVIKEYEGMSNLFTQKELELLTLIN